MVPDLLCFAAVVCLGLAPRWTISAALRIGILVYALGLGG